MAFLARSNHGTCTVYHPGALGPNSQYIMLRKGVGQGGENAPDRVKEVQAALNKLPADKGGAVPKLPENGIADSALNDAIVRFKTVNNLDELTPLLIHPMLATIRLNELVLAERQLVKSNSEIQPFMRSLVGEAQSCIRCARHNLEMAKDSLAGLNLPGVTSADRLRLLNRHFALDRNPLKRQTIDYIYNVFCRMGQVFERPGELWGTFVLNFEDAPPDRGWLAYARAGGFFRGGEIEDGVRQDSIYITELMRLSSRDQAVQTIVHELAHFCGPKIGETIADHGYGLPTDPRMTRLTPYLRMLNAECYGNFAWECKTGRDSAGMM